MEKLLEQVLDAGGDVVVLRPGGVVELRGVGYAKPVALRPQARLEYDVRCTPRLEGEQDLTLRAASRDSIGS